MTTISGPYSANSSYDRYDTCKPTQSTTQCSPFSENGAICDAAKNIGSTLIGTIYNDDLTGSEYNDSIHGRAGNDVLIGKAGDDCITGGRGKDILIGDSGNDVLKGGQDNDYLNGGTGDDRLKGNKGDDTLHGGSGNDRLHGGKGDDALFGGDNNDVLKGGRGNDTLNGGNGNDVLKGGRGDDTLISGEGDNTLRAGKGADIIEITGTGNNTVNGGRGDDTLKMQGSPIDYRFSESESGALVITHVESGATTTVKNVESIQFSDTDDKSFTASDLSESPFLTDRVNISIYGDTTLNRLVVMNLDTMEMIQEIPVPGGINVYSVDYVTEDKSYITPRGSDFIQVLNRNEEGVFELGEQIPLDFKPRTPNRSDANGLVLYSGSDKAMWALVDPETDEVVAQGGRDEVTLGTFSNYDSDWATGHAQWVSADQFLVPDRESNNVSLWQVTQGDNGAWSVEQTDVIELPGSIHTLFGTHTLANGDIVTYAPGEGSNDVNNTDAQLYELKIIDDSLSINRSVNVSGGLHHPSIHPDKSVMYAPTSNGFVDVIDMETFEVIKSLPAGADAGHVTIIADRNLALITNHGDEFVTAIDISTNEVIKNIPVTTDNPDVDNALQAHTGRVSQDGQYFYNFATDQGTFFRINLDTLEVDATFFTGGTPKQASQPGELG